MKAVFNYRLSRSTFRAFWDLHGWAGVVASLVVYVLFLFGTCALFHPQLLDWQEPAVAPASFADVDRAVDTGLATGELPRRRVYVYLPTDHHAGFAVGHSDAGGHWVEQRVAGGGALVPQRSMLADFLLRLHFLWFDSQQWLYPIAGVAAAVLVLVVVTGVLIHLRDLVRQLHQFRPDKRLRVAWSDAHKVLGTFGIPFVLLFALTGAWMALDPVVMPRVAALSFEGDRAAAARAEHGEGDGAAVTPAGETAARLPLAELIARARAAHPGLEPTGVWLLHTGDREAIAEVLGEDPATLFGDAEVRVRQRDGAPVASAEADEPPLAAIRRVGYGLHFAHYGGMALRILYAVLALAGCATILTGNWLWLARRRPSRATWLVQRATIAVGAGSLIAIGAICLANRALPWELADRPDVEIRIFTAAWIGAAVWALVARSGTRLWQSQLAVAGLLLVAATLVGAVSLGAGVVELWLAAIGAALIALALRLRRGRR